MDLLNSITLLSYLALTADILFQIKHLRHTKSSRDISLSGVFIRYLAILIIFYKFFTLDEGVLLVGQGLLAIVFTLYLFLALCYHGEKIWFLNNLYCKCKDKFKKSNNF
jgi:hypothetical protein